MFRPSTNMNASGKMKTLKYTYENKNEYRIGNRKLTSAYASNKNLVKNIKNTTYVNYPN